MSDFIPYPGVSSAPPVAASHLTHDAHVAVGSLDRAFVGVDATFAECLTTTHAQWFELALEGQEEFTRDVPNRGEEALQHLDERGLPAVGTEVKPGTLLIGCVMPRGDAVLSPEEKLLRAIFGEAAGEVVDRSLQTPGGIAGTVSAVELEGRRARVQLSWTRKLERGDVLELDGAAAVVAHIEPLAADLSWSGGASRVRVRKVAIARDALEARSIGPYEPTSQQPVLGRARFGGQTFPRRLAATLAARAPWSVWEAWTLKSDAVNGRTRAYESVVKGENPGADALRDPEEAP
jgi:DNA-directed RNA polymerase beta subunit